MSKFQKKKETKKKNRTKAYWQAQENRITAKQELNVKS